MFYKIFKKRAEVIKYLPRAERVLIYPFHNIHFVLKTESHENKVRIINLSSEGMGLFFDDFKKHTKVRISDSYSGYLNFEGKKTSLTIQVAHTTSDIIGCCVTSPIEDFKNNFINLFYYELLGKQFFEVESPQSVNEASSNINVRWWNGGENLDLKIAYENEEFSFFEITIFDMCIQGRGKKDVNISEKKDLGFKENNNVETREVTNELEEDLIGNIEKLLSNIQELEGSIQQNIIEILNNQSK
jgi:hypothetical protein